MALEAAFWRKKSLGEMSDQEWEALCDGCGQCCLHRFEDDATGEVFATNVACRLLDLGRCQCNHYPRRQRHVPECVQLTPDNLHEHDWLPETCAYQRVARGLDLPDWHYLRCGDRQAVHRAGVSVQNRAVSEANIHPDDLAEFLGIE